MDKNRGGRKPKKNMRREKMKEGVMKLIREKKIKMRNPFVFTAERLGLESALAGFLILAALLAGTTLYFLKRTGVMDFWHFGIPGIRVILLTLPYDYIVLFVLALALAVYLSKKADIFPVNLRRANILILLFFLGTVAAGLAFVFLGTENFIHGWSRKKLPEETAVRGKIEDISPGNVIILEDDGKFTDIKMGEFDKSATRIFKYEKGKYLNAVGRRDKENPKIFYAEKVHCCQGD